MSSQQYTNEAFCQHLLKVTFLFLQQSTSCSLWTLVHIFFFLNERRKKCVYLWIVCDLHVCVVTQRPHIPQGYFEIWQPARGRNPLLTHVFCPFPSQTFIVFSFILQECFHLMTAELLPLHVKFVGFKIYQNQIDLFFPHSLKQKRADLSRVLPQHFYLKWVLRREKLVLSLLFFFLSVHLYATFCFHFFSCFSVLTDKSVSLRMFSPNSG